MPCDKLAMPSQSLVVPFLEPGGKGGTYTKLRRYVRHFCTASVYSGTWSTTKAG